MYIHVGPIARQDRYDKELNCVENETKRRMPVKTGSLGLIGEMLTREARKMLRVRSQESREGEMKKCSAMKEVEQCLCLLA